MGGSRNHKSGSSDGTYVGLIAIPSIVWTLAASISAPYSRPTILFSVSPSTATRPSTFRADYWESTPASSSHKARVRRSPAPSPAAFLFYANPKHHLFLSACWAVYIPIWDALGESRPLRESLSHWEPSAPRHRPLARLHPRPHPQFAGPQDVLHSRLLPATGSLVARFRARRSEDQQVVHDQKPINPVAG
ncbi:hypothetical protein BD311DRAFT_146290 [Dichomitus squalens]|uniref:Uncharacterized protein n=1 Tax=Dichomitus squalens TaxID=114155 RepID=A0A4Q9MT65_9APHY|nr:hypothetical protein BD311DRAFT_146290 [Dichomitus squalens]